MKWFTLMAFSAWMQQASADGTSLTLSDYPSLTPSVSYSTIAPSPLTVSRAESDQPSVIPTIESTSSREVDRGGVIVVSDGPSLVPSDAPSAVPSAVPTIAPTITVSSPAPTLKIERGAAVDSDYPSLMPSDAPSAVPSSAPSSIPSDAPSMLPSALTARGTESDVPSITPTLVGGSAATVDGVTFDSSVNEVMDDEQVEVFEDVVATQFLPEFLPKVYPADYKDITCSVLNQDMLVDSERRRLQEQTGNIEIKTSAVAILMRVKSQVDLPEGVNFGDIVSQTFGSYSSSLQGLLSAAMPSYFNKPTNSTEDDDGDDSPRAVPAETYESNEDKSTPWGIIVGAIVGGAVVALFVSYIILDQKKKTATNDSVQRVEDVENVNYSQESDDDHDDDEHADYDDHDDTHDYDEEEDDDDDDEDTRKILGESSHGEVL